VTASTARHLRYRGTCARCNATVYPGDWAYYDRATRTVHCMGCGAPTSFSPVQPARPGASAGREYQRRRAAREDRIRRRLPLGAAFVARVTEPQHQRAWAIGEEGELRAAKALQKRVGPGVALLHDRRKPRSRGNIDHLAIGPGGVTVIDTKKLKGAVRVEHRGFVHRRSELHVGGREKTALVAGVEGQVGAVRALLEAEGFGDVDLRGALQFVDADLPLLGLEDIRGVVLGSPRKIAKLARRSGQLTAEQVEAVADLLDRKLPAA
jgi:hypothetical protein